MILPLEMRQNLIGVDPYLFYTDKSRQVRIGEFYHRRPRRRRMQESLQRLHENKHNKIFVVTVGWSDAGEGGQ